MDILLDDQKVDYTVQGTDDVGTPTGPPPTGTTVQYALSDPEGLLAPLVVSPDGMTATVAASGKGGVTKTNNAKLSAVIQLPTPAGGQPPAPINASVDIHINASAPVSAGLVAGAPVHI